MSYHETIAALKDFTAAQRRLDSAEKAWDDCRYGLYPQLDPDAGGFKVYFFFKSEYLGSAAQEFLSAHNAYERLSYVIPQPEIAKTAQTQADAIAANEITERFLERVDPFEGGICELGR